MRFGQPLHESDYAHDPRNPVESFIPRLLGQQTQARVIVVARDKMNVLKSDSSARRRSTFLTAKPKRIWRASPVA
jgi:uncharacterized protein YgbK (DUF1537 family)